VFANLSDGIVVVDDAGRVVDLNRPARRLFPSAAIGCGVDEVSSAPRRSRISCRATGLSTGPGRVAPRSGPGRRSPGDRRRWVRSPLSDGRRPLDRRGRVRGRGRIRVRERPPEFGSTSAAGGTVLLFRDVTERETLQRRYRALIEKSPNIIAVCGTDGLLRYVSPSIERLLGHSPAEIEGRPVIDLVHPDDRREAQRAFECAFETGEPQAIDHRIAHADGNWRQFDTRVERLFEDTEEVVITATDVTEIRRSEQRLQVLNRVLRHDLKNDTNVIGGYANLLRNHVDEEGDDYLDIIDRKVETLTHLSDQAREIDVTLHRDGARAEIDLSELVTRLCESLESSFRGRR